MTDTAANDDLAEHVAKKRAEALERHKRNANQAAHAAEREFQDRVDAIERASRRPVPPLTAAETGADLSGLRPRSAREVSPAPLLEAASAAASAEAEYLAAVADESQRAADVKAAKKAVLDAPPGAEHVSANAALSGACEAHDAAVRRVRAALARANEAERNFDQARAKDAEQLAAIAER